jgi:hypothetical protein
MTAQQRQVFDPASASMVGVMIAAVVLGALAVKTLRVREDLHGD